MPRIDPVKLLECLSVLLSPTGGIKSKDEVQRLASLMTKFSKKLVSKCIYIQILKKTGTELLGSFMSAGGWTLVHMWLSDGIMAKNWPLIKELLELLLLCPVDVERLKTNNFPKLVKELSKDSSQTVVQALASKLVEQWLKLVKGEPAPPLILEELPNVLNEQNIDNVKLFDNSKLSNDIQTSSLSKRIKEEPIKTKEEFVKIKEEFVKTKEELVNIKEENSEEEEDSDSQNDEELSLTKNDTSSKVNLLPKLKISVKDGKQVVSKVTDKSDAERKFSKSEPSTEKDSDKKKKDSRSRSSSSSRSSSGSKSKHSVKSSSGDRRHSSSSNSDNNSKSKDKYKKPSSSYKEADKNKNRKTRGDEKSDKRREHEKNRERGDKNKDKSENSKEQSDKTRDFDKTQEQLNKLQPMSIMKLGKIPKKSNSIDKTDITKEKPSISIEVRDPNESNRPKTVKMFNSKFRSHGLEEEAKPPPPRGSVKKPNLPSTLPALVPTKRPSPIRSLDVPPPEKKIKLVDNTERPGAIKLIPPKPKPMYLLESGSFMDALAASATNKKEPRKRKRRISGSKDNPAQNDISPPNSPTSNPTTPTSPVAEESKSTPLRFYQDTLDTEDEEKDKENTKSCDEDIKIEIITHESESPLSPLSKKEDASNKSEDADADVELDVEPNLGGLKGVLCLHKKKGPKKTLKWRDTNLEEVQYFELDETERVNVTKNFLDMKQMEHHHERESVKKVRNLSTEDFMEEKISWRKLTPIDIDKDVMVDFGKNSKEKEVQLNRQKLVLQAMYLHKGMIPDFPTEADIENHPMSEPINIPIDDVTGNPDSVNNFQSTPWPDPKVSPPIMPVGMPNPQMYQNLPPFNAGFNNPPPFVMPGFQNNPGVMPGMPNEWPANGPNMMMPDANMNPEMFMNPGPGPMFPGPMNEFPMMDNVNNHNFQPGFPVQMGPGGMNRPMGPGPGPYGFGKNRGGGVRGPIPRGGHMNWRSKGPGWNGPHRGGGGHRGTGRPCTHFQKKGFCRQGDSCPFVHSGSNRSHY